MLIDGLPGDPESKNRNVERNVIIAQRFASQKMVALHLLGIRTSPIWLSRPLSLVLSSAGSSSAVGSNTLRPQDLVMACSYPNLLSCRPMLLLANIELVICSGEPNIAPAELGGSLCLSQSLFPCRYRPCSFLVLRRPA